MLVGVDVCTPHILLEEHASGTDSLVLERVWPLPVPLLVFEPLWLLVP